MTAKMKEKKILMEVMESVYSNMSWSIERQEEQAREWDEMTKEEREEKPYTQEYSEHAKEWLKAWNTIEATLDKLI